MGSSYTYVPRFEEPSGNARTGFNMGDSADAFLDEADLPKDQEDLCRQEIY